MYYRRDVQHWFIKKADDRATIAASWGLGPGRALAAVASKTDKAGEQCHQYHNLHGLHVSQHHLPARKPASRLGKKLRGYWREMSRLGVCTWRKTSAVEGKVRHGVIPLGGAPCQIRRARGGGTRHRRGPSVPSSQTDGLSCARKLPPGLVWRGAASYDACRIAKRAAHSTLRCLWQGP